MASLLSPRPISMRSRCYFHVSEVGGLAGYILYTAVYLTCVEIGVSGIRCVVGTLTLAFF